MVVAVCLAVTLATVIAVDARRSAVPGSPKAAPAGAGQPGVDRSGTRVPPLGSSAGTDNQVPAHPADAIDALLDARAAAILDGDRGAWLAGLDPGTTPVTERFRAAQGSVFDRVASLRPASWAYQVAGGTALPSKRRTALGSPAWLAQVELDYQLIPGGPRVRREQSLTIVRRDGQWRIGADTDGPTARDVWDLGPISQASAKRCLVIGARDRRAQIARLAAECDGEAGRVDAAWGRSWTRRTVITVPNTVHQLGVLLGQADTGSAHGTDSTAGLERTAAVTVGPVDAAAEEVLINGVAFDRLSAVGRRVVVTHELVHVATRATGSRAAPTWLEEGFADYVAYRDTGLSAKQVAGDALAAVRAGRMPSGLPTTDDFNAAGNQASAAYGLAWVAVQVIAAKAGSTERMKAFYQQAAAGSSTNSAARTAIVDAALAQVGLHNTAAFVGSWQSRLRQLAQ